ncbi:hypothetical protein PMAYCL1PPCAC_10982, partial [Pristionchus mayeri]
IILQESFTGYFQFLELQSEGAPFETVDADGNFIPFFMNEEHKQKLLEMDFSAPEGFKIGSIDVPIDYEKMYDVWPFRALTRPETLRKRLEELPSVCVRADDGRLASWFTIHTFGELTHLYTLEHFRGKGLGLLVENLLSQMIAREGLHVFKYVVETNVDVIRRTMTHPLWSRWMSMKEGKDDVQEDVIWSFSLFKYRKGMRN